MVKKEFCSIRWSDLPSETDIRIVIPNPKEAIPMAIPNRDLYVVYKAYFKNEYIKGIKMFNVVFPYYPLQRAFLALPESQRNDLDHPVEMLFVKKRKSILIKEWKVLCDGK